jgi:hypothetical protein
MSTGDQSGYIRAKMAERGTSQGVQFMRDGFDNWAESTAPARAGQVEKMPAETQMTSTGGAMTLAKAKSLAKKMGMELYNGGAMCGGRSFLGIEIPAIVEKAIEWGEKVLNFALLVDKKLPEIIEGIEDEIIDNDRDPAITSKDKEIAKRLIPLLKDVKKGLNMLKNIKTYADQIKSALGSVGVGGMRGGAAKTAAERFADAVKYLKEKYEQIKNIVMFITDNAKFLKQLLKIRALQPIGKEILDKIQPIMALVGLGRGKSRSAKCECSDSEEYRGGRVFHEDSEMPTRPEFPTSRGGRVQNRAYRQDVEPPRHRGGFGIEDFNQAFGFGPQKQMGYSGDYGEPQQGMSMVGGPGMGIGGPVGGPGIGGPVVGPNKESRIEEIIQKMMQIKDSNMSSARKEKALEVLEKELKALRGGRRKRGGFGVDLSGLPGLGPMKYESTYEPMQEVMGPSASNEARKRQLLRKLNSLTSKKNLSEDEKEMAKQIEKELRGMSGGRTAFKSTTSSSRGSRTSGVGGRKRKPSARGEIVKKVMRERGLSLPQASKYVKENGLY